MPSGAPPSIPRGSAQVLDAVTPFPALARAETLAVGPPSAPAGSEPFDRTHDEAYGHPFVRRDERGHWSVPGVPRGPSVHRLRVQAGPNPDPRRGQLLRPHSGVHLSLAPTPRSTRRDGSVCPRVPPPALSRLRLSPLALGPLPVPAGVPVMCAHKALPSVPGIRYNPHSP
jgi:hypothetical protein